MSLKEDLQIREICMEVLLSVFRQEEFSHVLIKGVLDKNDDWEPGKKAFFKKLTMGVLERKTELDYVISKFCKQSIPRIRPVLLVILEMGAYQILYMDHVYDTKACNLCVELAKKKGFKNLAGFVNGVLRAVAANKDTIEYPKAEEDPEKYLSVRYSFPEWMVKLFLDRYGLKKTEAILQSYLEEQDLSVHISGAISEEEQRKMLSSWENAGVQINKCTFLPNACALSADKTVRIPGVKELKGFSEGYFTVQDFTSQLVGYFAPLPENAVIVDCCAAPGGKSLYLADRIKSEGKGGRVYAFDVSEAKVNKIRENIARVGNEAVSAAVWDATIENSDFIEKADVVLTDVPCSGLGVIGKKPDLKYRILPADFKSITELQKKIVTEAVKMVKPGGTLIYSTCTVNKAENEDMCDWITANLPLEESTFTNYPKEIEDCRISEGRLQFLPGEHGCDGFFIALFKKQAR